MEIIVSKNGPLRVKSTGDKITIKDADGGEYDVRGRELVSLCRCGQSENKPFCDGTHNKIGFQHEAKAYVLPEPKK
jgi:CDGSH-type Zn-finger protein